MKKIIFQFSVSLDGYFEGPNHEIDWHLVDDKFNAYAVEMLKATEVLIMGRRNYELMASYWPTTDNDPVIKEKMNETPKLVFSRSLKKVEWKNSRLATGSIADEEGRLKQSPGNGLLWVGGSELAASFLELGLLDELRFIITPILLGGGKTVFDGLKKRHSLRLLSTRKFQSGNMLAIYEPMMS